MQHSPANLDGIPLDGVTAQTLLTQFAEVAHLLMSNPDHPNVDLAVHVLDLHVAAASVVATASDTHVDLTAGANKLTHTCATHIEAALLLISAGHNPGAESAAEVCLKGMSTVRNLLT